MNQESNRGQFSFSKDERINNKKVIQDLDIYKTDKNKFIKF